MPAMSELKKDMEILRKAGFNHIKLQEHWAYDEPEEGCFDFSKYEELIDCATKLDLGVYLGLTCEQAPNWLYLKYPDCAKVRRDGTPLAFIPQSTMPGDGKPGPCFDHPGAMSDMLRFIRRLVETLGVFENIAVWNTWQEIGYGRGDVCYCESTLNFFREWLRKKYGSIDNLNKNWRTRYAEWKHVFPDRHESGKTCIPQNFAWQYFMSNVQICATLKARADTIRRADPFQRPVFAHVSGPGIGSDKEWRYAECQDFLGTSVYPAWWHRWSWDDKDSVENKHLHKRSVLQGEMWHTFLKMDYIRSCNPPGAPVWVAEMQGGPVCSHFARSRAPSREDIRRWMLTLLASGATAVSYWVTRAEIMADEANGFSLLDSEGDSSERFEEASRIGAALNRHADIFAAPSLAQASVAALVNGENFHLCQSMFGPAGEHLAYSLRGWHRILKKSGVNMDFLDISQMDGSFESKYKVLILPFPVSLSEDYALALAQYVRQGGNLISEACPGRIDENGFCRRGELSPAAREIFGVRHKKLVVAGEPGAGHRWTQEHTWDAFIDEVTLDGAGPLAGHKLRASLHVETFEPEGAQTVLLNGDETAGTVNSYGEGAAWLIGTFVGHNGTAYSDDGTWAVVLRVLSHCGVTPLKCGELLLSKRVTSKKEAWILLNPTENDVTEEIDTKDFLSAADIIEETVFDCGGKISVSIKSLDGKILVFERK
jgi:beta-galactosidase